MRVSYLLPDCGVGGGPKVVLHHLNWLYDHGHDAQLYIVNARPDWFDVRAPVNVCSSYEDACARLSERDGIKVATWWETAPWVIRSCEGQGAPIYLVQDIETSYYRPDDAAQNAILETYHLPWTGIVTDSPWTKRRLQEMGVSAFTCVLGPPVDLDIYRRRADVARDPNRIACIGRGNPLKNPELMRGAMGLLESWGVPLRVASFGIEPHIVMPLQETYHERVTEDEAAAIYNSASAFVLTSKHEGFGVPLLEAMACGCPVITTLADGNDHFCEDGYNCLVVLPDPYDVAAAIYRLWRRPALQQQIAAGGLETVSRYSLRTIGVMLEVIYRVIGGNQ